MKGPVLFFVRMKKQPVTENFAFLCLICSFGFCISENTVIIYSSLVLNNKNKDVVWKCVHSGFFISRAHRLLLYFTEAHINNKDGKPRLGYSSLQSPLSVNRKVCVRHCCIPSSGQTRKKHWACRVS